MTARKARRRPTGVIPNREISEPLKFTITPQDVAAGECASEGHCVVAQSIMRCHPEIRDIKIPSSSPLVSMLVPKGRASFLYKRGTLGAVLQREANEFDKHPGKKVWTLFGDFELGVPPKSLKAAYLKIRAAKIRKEVLAGTRKAPKTRYAFTGSRTRTRTLNSNEARRNDIAAARGL